jgi:hypothetical protein
MSDEWKSQSHFEETLIGHSTNLAFLEQGGEKSIDVVSGRLVT